MSGARFLIITRPGCSYCDRAKDLLKSMGLDYHEDTRSTPEEQKRFKEAGYRSYPQIFDGRYPVGGFSELVGHLDAQEDSF